MYIALQPLSCTTEAEPSELASVTNIFVQVPRNPLLYSQVSELLFKGSDSQYPVTFDLKSVSVYKCLKCGRI